MSTKESNRVLSKPLKLEVEMKRDGTLKMTFPSLDDETLIHLVQNLPQLNGSLTKGEEGGANEYHGHASSISSSFRMKSRKLEERIERIEEKISKLVDISEELSQCVAPSGKEDQDEVKIPSNGTKYNRVLKDLALEFGGSTFDSTSIPESERHILSILNNRYNALEVVDNRGRTNIYSIREDVIHEIFSEEGECIDVEIRGKPRKVVERVLRSNKDNYPKFSYVLKEGADQRQVYTLIFGDRSVKVSVMENLSRSVGSNRNMKIYSS